MSDDDSKAQLTCGHGDDGFHHCKELHGQWEGQALHGKVGLVEEFQQRFGNLRRLNPQGPQFDDEKGDASNGCFQRNIG